MELRQAQRRQAKIKLALQGASGTGKTFSALSQLKGVINLWEYIF
jgi:Rad3-related DNA helicase